MKIVLPKDGKIIIPQKIQRELGLQPGDTLEFIVKKQDLVIRRAILWHYDGLIVLVAVAAVFLFTMKNKTTTEVVQNQQGAGSRGLPQRSVEVPALRNLFPPHTLHQATLPSLPATKVERQRIEWTPPSQRTKPLYHTAPPALKFKRRLDPPIFIKQKTNTTTKASSENANVSSKATASEPASASNPAPTVTKPTM